MTDGFLFDMIEKLVGKLGSLAVKAWNVRDDVEKLVDNMSEIKAVIMDAEEQQHGANSHQVKLWLEKLKYTLYDAEDLLDDFSTEHLRRHVMTRDTKAKKVRIFFSSSNQLLFSFKMVPKIKKLRKTIEDLNINGKSFKFTKRSPLEPRVMKQRETHSFIPEEEVIGREEEKKELIELLLNINVKENVSVISIVGIGGLGKTALAQLVFNHKDVQQHFELRMWVCVADDSDVRGFDLKGIAEKILETKSNGELEPVQRELRKKVERKRYLLVLDDIWTEDRGDWHELMKLLVGGGKGSKIIVTTRKEEVAKITSTRCSPPTLFLKGLDEQQSWRLFCQQAFKNGQESEDQDKVSIGQEIVKKCAGVPLAIRSIGNLMYSMESEKDWSDFKEKDLVKIDEKDENKVFKIIKLSYDHLPFHLKRCFAFCSLFPKDTRIYKRDLIRLWIAEGFVQSADKSPNMEDTADKYIMTLIHGSFFQDFEANFESGDSYWRFKMHDLMHDLACFISRNDYVMVNEKRKHINKQTHHVSVLDSSWQVSSFLPQANKLRTFILWYTEEFDCNMIISSLDKIRVLKLPSRDLTTIPSCIGMLKHLRYLDLSDNKNIEVLPSSITNLINLEFLLLSYCLELSELPKDLWKLTSLRHLEFYGCPKITCMPRGIERLVNLQTLTKFVLGTTSKHNASASELRDLNNLRGDLQIEGLEYLRHRSREAKEMNLLGKSHVWWLELYWSNEIDGDVNDDVMEKDDIILRDLLMPPKITVLAIGGYKGVGVAFSRPNNSFTNLKVLWLYDCTRLKYLPQLRVERLTLYNLPCLEWIVNDDSNDDNSSVLTPLSIELLKLHNLKGWCRCSEEEMQRGCCHHRFKSVDYMCIEDCPNMISIPQCTESIRQLKLSNVREKIFQQVVVDSKMKHLYISNMHDLKYLSGVLQHLTALVDLTIGDCKELDLCNYEGGCNYGTQWKELKNLQSLIFQDIPKMKYLPEGLQHVKTLEVLEISDCNNLTVLPEWVTSILKVRIYHCPNLTSVPTGVKIFEQRVVFSDS